MKNLPQDKVFSVACYFIEKNKKDNKGLTNKKLQKLLYYSQAWNLVFKNKELFNEKIEAWVHGPAIKKVYEFFKEFGYKEISENYDDSCISSLSAEELELLDSIWEVYGKYDGDYLEILSHSEEPWQKARKSLAPFEASSNIISTDTMKSYYGQKIKSA